MGYWEVVEILGGGSWWEEAGHWRGDLEGDCCPFLLSLLGYHEGIALLHQALPTVMVSLVRGPETMEPSDHRLRPVKP